LRDEVPQSDGLLSRTRSTFPFCSCLGISHVIPLDRRHTQPLHITIIADTWKSASAHPSPGIPKSTSSEPLLQGEVAFNIANAVCWKRVNRVDGRNPITLFKDLHIVEVG